MCLFLFVEGTYRFCRRRECGVALVHHGVTDNGNNILIHARGTQCALESAAEDEPEAALGLSAGNVESQYWQA